MENKLFYLTAEMVLGGGSTIEAGNERKQPNIEMRDGNKRREQPGKPYSSGVVSVPAAATKESSLAVIGGVSSSPDPRLKIGLSIGNGQMKPEIESKV